MDLQLLRGSRSPLLGFSFAAKLKEAGFCFKKKKIVQLKHLCRFTKLPLMLAKGSSHQQSFLHLGEAAAKL